MPRDNNDDDITPFGLGIGLVVYITYMLLPIKGAWLVFFAFAAMTAVRPERPSVPRMIAAAITLATQGLHPVEILLVCLILDAHLMDQWDLVHSVIAGLLGSVFLYYGIIEVFTPEPEPEPSDWLAMIPGMSLPSVRTVGAFFVAVLAIVPSMVWEQLAETRILFPMDLMGIFPALAFYCMDLFFPIGTQWLMYFCFALLHLVARQSPWVILEGVILTGVAWLLDFTPVFPYAATYIAKAVIHPLYRLHWLGIPQTRLFGPQASGALWFSVTHITLAALRGIFGTGFDSFSRIIIWVTIPLRAAFLVGLQLYHYFYALQQRTLLPVSNPRGNTAAPARRSARLETYRHRALPSERHVRLLAIRPSSSQSKRKIECDLVEARFAPDGRFFGPIYSAISYRWIYTGFRRLIWINNQPFMVANNVYEILHWHRERAALKYIWIDALCIDQSNDSEKEVQVPLMRNIYEACAGAECWVRTVDPYPDRISPPASSRSVEDMAYTMIQKLKTSYVMQERRIGANPRRIFEQHKIDFWLALEEFLSDDYFTRMWIIQEVVASIRVMLHYGPYQIHWNDFAQVISALNSNGLRNFPYYIREYQRFAHRRAQRTAGVGINEDDDPNLYTAIELRGFDNAHFMENLRQWYGRDRIIGWQRGTLLPLLDTLQLCLRFDSGAVHDRLYALLGLIDPGDQQNITVTYETVPRKVFTDAARLMLGKSELHRVLRFAGIGRRRNISDLPSWAPDWTAGLQSMVLCQPGPANYAASLALPPRFGVTFKSMEMSCDALVFDVIKELSEIFTGSPSSPTRRR